VLKTENMVERKRKCADVKVKVVVAHELFV